MKKAVLFDLDGTLWHTCDVILPVWTIYLKNIKKQQTNYTWRNEQLYGKDGWTDCVNNVAWVSAWKFGRNCKRVLCGTDSVTSQNGGHLYDNLESTLEILSKNYFLGIISNCQCGYIEAFLFAHKLEKYFSDFEMSGRTNLTKGENKSLLWSVTALIRLCISAIQSVSACRKRRRNSVRVCVIRIRHNGKSRIYNQFVRWIAKSCRKNSRLIARK